MALRLKAIVVLSWWLCVHVAFGQRTWYFSSSQGDDRNDGKTPATALRSVQMLQHLLWGGAIGGDALQRGDTIALLRGDTFRVVYAQSWGPLAYWISLHSRLLTQPGLPVVITAYGPPDAPLPMITGTWRLSDSARSIVVGTDGIVRVAKPFGGHDSLMPLRVFYKGIPLTPARFPNDTMLILSNVRAQDPSQPDTLVLARGQGALPSAAGALVWASVGADYSWGCSKVIRQAGDSLITLSWGWAYPLRGSRFYLEGKREFIDKPGEWYYDEQTDTLYLLPPELPFEPQQYEMMVIGINQANRNINYLSRGLVLTISYDTLPRFPLQNVVIENIHFSRLVEGVRLAGVKDVTIRNCMFTDCFRGVWNFLAEGLSVVNNKFFDTGVFPVCVYGRTPARLLGHPGCMTRKVYVEHNTIKRTGFPHRWSWQTASVDSSRFVVETGGIIVGHNIDSVIVRYNVIDSSDQAGIFASYVTEARWDSAYKGTIPFVIEKNLITNFCMHHSDCAAIKLGFYCRNGIVRNNILIKGHNGDKSHHAYIVRPFAIGIYSDVGPHDVVWDGNTVIGTDLGCHNYYGGGPVRNIKIYRNTFYNCRVQGADAVAGEGTEIRGCEVRGNVFFGPMHGTAAVAALDYSRNGRADRFDLVNENLYALPTYAPAYFHWSAEERRDFVYGFGQLRSRTPYEQSPLSRWLEWVQLRAWDTARVKRQLIRNAVLEIEPLPIRPFGGVQMERVANSPLGGPAVMLWYPDTARNHWAGFVMVSGEPFYSTLTAPNEIYRWSLLWASNRRKEYWSVWWPRTIHPNTGDTIIIPYHFALPVRQPYKGDTLRVYYQPRFRQFWTMPHVVMEPGDTVWLSYYNVEEIDPQTVPSFEELFPIFINPSDTVRTVELPRGWVYMTLDSQVVWGRVQVAPWGSRILMRVRYDTTVIGHHGEVPLQKWAVVYPNPVEEMLTVLLPERGTVRVVSVDGREVYRGVVEERVVVPMSGLAAGVYLVHIQYNEGRRETLKVVHRGTTAK
ncbi:MAG: right-handed parallel beta-helix repeat-containing protein [Candidatus Kapabacteria bacterium]|nr:right-handed parallel beta-helix repeat-containing protein [Candidatus Kapabacteria bacterium]MDW8012612.1 right-handed parallel beta-helix repeat-containing protein [Bacteroidota bacterium]